jgi:hypothetical protein
MRVSWTQQSCSLAPLPAGLFVSSLDFFSFQQCFGLPQTSRESAADVQAMRPLTISQIDLPISIRATEFYDACSEVIARIERTANVTRTARNAGSRPLRIWAYDQFKKSLSSTFLIQVSSGESRLRSLRRSTFGKII